TKVWNDKLNRRDFIPSVEESLRKLQLDRVDLLLIHWPPDGPLEESVEQLVAARDRQLTRLIGVSNFPTALLQRTLDLGADIVTNQVEYHALLDQSKVLNLLRNHGMFLTAYSPIGQGAVVDDPTLREIGAAHGKSAAQVALRWLVQQGDVAAIPRTTRPERLQTNIDLFDFVLSTDEMATVTALTHRHERQVDPPFAPAWDQP
ncbi:MAG: aldo/keto reductase, partial [Catalinimonas sp.]